MSKKGTSSSTFTPPPEVVEAYKEALGYGRAAMGQQYAPYTGEITAPLTPTQESGIYNVNRAVGTAIPYFGQATAMTANAANTPITPQQFSQEAIQQYQSPYTQAVADATYRNLREQQRQEQEQLQSGAIRAGAFGGDRAGIAAANLARQQDLATAQAMSNIYNQGYGQAVGLFGQQQGVNYGADVANAARQLQGAQQLAGLGTGLQSSVLQGAQAQLAAGAQQQAVQQAINSGYYNQYLGAQAYPYQQAQFFANLATGVGGQMGGTTTGQQAQPSPVGSIFGALGAIGSIMSDKRAKENIKPIGKTNDGQTIYRFNYKGDHTTQIGLLAQEVEKKHPEAVTTINGLKGVDYKEATDDSVRSMGGGVVPTSQRHNFAGGGHTIDEEEDPMVPYVSGVPAKVRQIPKLAKIGGSKPNFGGTPPGPAQGPSSKDFAGAAEGLGAIYDKFKSSDSKMGGFENLGKDFEDMLPASAFSAAFAARGGAIGGLRPRFADGEDVPETRDSIYIPDRDRADIIRPSFNPESDAAPVRLASLGDAARRTDAGIPSSEPIREPARDVNVGLVPSMARSNADLPPLFAGKETPEPSQMAVAAKQAVDAEPETPEAKPVSVPSMARADTNVPAVKPGLEPAKAPVQAQVAPLTGADRDAVIRTIIGESGREPYEGQLGVAQVIRNRQLSGRYGKSASDVVYAPKQFSVWNPGDPAGAMANKIDPNSPLYQRIGKMVDQVWAGEAEDPTKGATHFANVATVMAQRGSLQPWLQNMVDSGKTIKIGGHTFGQADAGASEPTEAKARVRVADAGLGAAKTATDAASGDRKWNFGMAGEGKRSVIESIMDRDFDPIQKRALFAFFAGMAASPSPWFGQQLGAGMQAASNVYNDSMNKQAELGIKKEQLGLEEQKIGVSKQLADVQEKTKAIEALKFWQSRFKQIPTPEGFSYLDTTTGQTISQDEYNRQMGQITKQLKLTPTDTGIVTAKPGLAPSAPAGAAPAGGLAPQPKPEVKVQPEVDGGAGTETAPITIPKPTEVTKPTAEAKPAEAPAKAVEAAKPKGETEDVIYQNVRDDYNPIVLRQKADEQRKIATNAQKLGDLAGAKAANDLADSYSKKAIDITENKVPVVFKDGTVGRIPQIEQEALRAESVKGAQKINVEENTKWMNTEADAQAKRDMLASRINQLSNILETYESGRFAEQKANLVASLKAMGINVPNFDTSNPAKFEEFVKNQINNVFDEVRSIGGQVRVAEIQGLQQAQAGPGMQPEANRAILGYSRGMLNWESKRFDDAVEAVDKGGIQNFNRAKWMREWSKANDLNEYVKKGKQSVAALGATPDTPTDLDEGQHYILKEGQYGAPKRGKYIYRGIREQNGQRGLVFEPVGAQ